MKSISSLLLILFVVAGLTVSAGAETKAISYEFTRLEGDTPSFRVAVSFRGDSDGKTALLIPNEWGGRTELYKAIRDLTVSGGNARFEAGPHPHERFVIHEPNQKIHVQYTLVQDFEGPFRDKDRYRPVISSDYIHWIGDTVLIKPDWSDDQAVSASFKWRNLPKTWKFASSLGLDPLSEANIPFSELGRSIVVAGDYRVISTEVKGSPVNIAIRGNWQFKDSDFAEIIRRVIGSQRKFWNDFGQPYYLVTLTPIDEGPDASSFGGTGLRNSFALFGTPNMQLGPMLGLLAHEYFHNWNPVQLGRMPDPEQGTYWFSEGFTEYYAYRLLYRDGLMTADEYVARVNAHMRDYYLLPVREEHNERIVKDFWKDSGINRLPYLRGFVFATNLNAEIEQASNGRYSLDDVMHDLHRRSKSARLSLTPDSIAESIRRFHPAYDMAAAHTRFIEKGALIAPHANGVGPDHEIETHEIAVFELGFSWDVLAKTRKIDGVKVGTAAYNAGLRNDQAVTGGVSINFGDTTKEVSLRVKDAEGEKTVKYLPVSERPLSVPQFRRRTAK